jgi:hypothetical protein
VIIGVRRRRLVRAQTKGVGPPFIKAPFIGGPTNMARLCCVPRPIPKCD